MMSIPPNIVVDPEICHGKPTIKGTRVLVSVILDHLEQGISYTEIMEAFPRITEEDIKACLTYARTVVEGIEYQNYSASQVSH
ncbi:MAG: DUF433 domain-containing protein [Candidatus Kariarchaeaceae archaeon]|jgi:uncharacterized protein (DUF433 family)